VKITLAGKEQLISQLRGLPSEIDAAVGEALKVVGDETRDHLRAALPPGAGESSAPGEAPHSQTGNLKNSIYSKVDPRLLGREILLTVGIRARAFYGFILEYGANKYARGFKRDHRKGAAKNKSAAVGARILPRPWFWPAMASFSDKAPAATEAGINKVLRKYA
jgi:hypothetical protein